MHVCHITTVHPRTDTRIFLKYCKIFAQNYGSCSLIVADGKGSCQNELVNVLDVGKSRNALFRVIFGSFRVVRKALNIDVDVYHLHDPELVFAGIFLRLLNKTVIMDIHEDAPNQMKDKHYLCSSIRNIFALTLFLLEKILFRFFSGLVSATPHLKKLYRKYNNNIIGIYNYLLLSELKNDVHVIQNSQSYKICFVGGIEEGRGIRQLIDSLPYINPKVELILGGNFPDQDFLKILKKSKGWAYVDYRGYLTRDDMEKVFSECVIGVVPFLPARNHINSLPNKIFEYMGAGLAILGSDFKYWKMIIEENETGYCVDTTDRMLIASQIKLMLDDEAGLKKMGENGVHLVKTKYNWDSQMESLLRFYSSVLNK